MEKDLLFQMLPTLKMPSSISSLCKELQVLLLLISEMSNVRYLLFLSARVCPSAIERALMDTAENHKFSSLLLPYTSDLKRDPVRFSLSAFILEMSRDPSLNSLLWNSNNGEVNNKSYHCSVFTYPSINFQTILLFLLPFAIIYPLGTVRPLYRTGVSLLSRERFFIYLINKYISLSDICLTVHHWYK